MGLERSLVHFARRVDIKILLALFLGLHAFAMAFPSDALVFDEAYYVPAARDLLSLRPSNIEHPFLGKAWAAVGILLFGDHWFGWRVFYVVLATLSLYIFYRLGVRFLGRTLAVYATLLLGFENMFFVHGSLALLDVPSIFFALLGYHLYFSKRFTWSAVALGLSLLSKETGVFLVLTILVYHLAKHWREAGRWIRPSRAAKPLAFLLIVAGVYALPVTAYDLVYQPHTVTTVVQPQVIHLVDEEGRVTATVTTTTTRFETANITNALQHTTNMVDYASLLTVTEQENIDAGNFAWNWVLLYPSSPYYVLSVNKTAVETRNGVEVEKTIVTTPVSWQGVGSMPIWWSVWALAPFLVTMLVRRRAGELEVFLLAWVASTYLPMLYLSFVIHRIVYPFYFLNTVPALCMGVPYMAKRSFTERGALTLFLLAYLAVAVFLFATYFPVRTLEQ